MREYFTEFPDFAGGKSIVSDDDRSAVHRTATGTHLGSLWSVEASGARVTFEGIDHLWRERDRLALTSDCFYMIDPETSLRRPPGVPPEAFDEDTEKERASMVEPAALDPAAAWPGHADPVVGDARGQLERAAAA